MALLIKLMKEKWISPPAEVYESFEGRNIIVTGATSGIGLAAAAKYASLGASKVIIAARDTHKGAQIQADLERKISTAKGRFEVWELDMNSYPSVVAFANRANHLDHLDIVVLNAGVRRGDFTLSKHGWEEDLQVNVLSTTLLGILLLSRLKASNHGTHIPVLEFVNSNLHSRVDIPASIRNSKSILGAYNKPDGFAAQKQYNVSKLLLMFATNTLALLTSSKDVIITFVCPGVASTSLGRDVKVPGINLFMSVAGVLFFRRPEQSANTYISGTAQNQKLHGRFWRSDEIQPVAATLRGEENEKLAEKVWREIVEVLGRDVPSVKEVLSTIEK